MRKKIESLYIHIPFCEHICHYCDFIKFLYNSTWVDEYLLALEKEIKSYHIKSVKTIYIGGGTPSCLNLKQLEKLFKIIAPLSKDVKEFCVEINPESIDIFKARLFSFYGVNRVSIGVQSTNDKILKSINRYHNFKMVKQAFNILREVGIDNINVDIILGLPTQDKKDIKKDLDRLIKLNPTHFSCYSLKVCPHTLFYLKNIKEVDDDISFEQYKMVNDILEKNGYIHYEVSNWAKKDKYSLHNLTYWKNERYYGVGLSSASYIDDKRCKNTCNLKKYIQGGTIVEEETVDKKDEEIYEIMLRLRTKWGIDDDEFKSKFNFSFIDKYKDKIDRLIDAKYLNREENSIIPTFNGLMALDYVILTLLDERG